MRSGDRNNVMGFPRWNAFGAGKNITVHRESEGFSMSIRAAGERGERTDATPQAKPAGSCLKIRSNLA